MPLSLARAAGAVAAQAWMLSGEFQRKVVAMLVASVAVACDDNRQLQNASRAPDLGTGVPPGTEQQFGGIFEHEDGSALAPRALSDE